MAGPAVRLSARDVRVLYYGDLEVSAESADGTARRLRIRVQTPPGLQAPDPAEVTVPAGGQAKAAIRIWRSSAQRGTRQPLTVVAEAMDGSEAAMASTTALAEVLPDPAWMPRLRRPLGALALLLMAGAAAWELRRRR